MGHTVLGKEDDTNHFAERDRRLWGAGLEILFAVTAVVILGCVGKMAKESSLGRARHSKPSACGETSSVLPDPTDLIMLSILFPPSSLLDARMRPTSRALVAQGAKIGRVERNLVVPVFFANC